MENGNSSTNSWTSWTSTASGSDSGVFFTVILTGYLTGWSITETVVPLRMANESGLVGEMSLESALEPLVESVRSKSVSRDAFNLTFSGIVRAQGISFGEATPVLHRMLGEDRGLLSKLT
jgi:hypothetical protein